VAKATRILVVDDEPQIRRFLRAALTSHGYELSEADGGEAAIKLAATEAPDVIILDLGLPDISGVEVIRRLREWSKTPIVVLSARSQEHDKIEAFDLGADDYVTKPFGMGELLARLRAALRHRLQEAGQAPVFRSGPLAVDLVKRQVSRDGTDVHLSPKEYDLLRLLVTHAGRVVTHQQLLREVWGPAQAHETQYLRIYVGQLRAKLEPDPAHPRLILTEPGVGYRLVAEEPPAG
jgi:two-component system, OmpR family, KDP operon response regulator KdpE